MQSKQAEEEKGAQQKSLPGLKRIKQAISQRTYAKFPPNLNNPFNSFHQPRKEMQSDPSKSSALTHISA